MNNWQDYQQAITYGSTLIEQLPLLIIEGRLKAVHGNVLEAEGCQLTIGQRCEIKSKLGKSVEAEVIGFDRSCYILMPLEKYQGIGLGDCVRPLFMSNDIAVGSALQGRIIDGMSRPIDDKGILNCYERIPVYVENINPLKRQFITNQLDVGVRAINALLSVGRGQRMGIFAGSGVGKSVLLGMMTRHTQADVTVVALIGERGREVREFIEHVLGEEGLKRAILVISPADESPVLRLRASIVAHRIAEYFRDKGSNVLLLMDSLTRFAQAQREIALSSGEPPSSRGFPPSAFSLMAQMLERAGNGYSEKGSLTTFYTVLVEGDIEDDPVADSAKAILDGHIMLTRERSLMGVYPAIDLTLSISRSMRQITSSKHNGLVSAFRQFYERSREVRELFNMGAYTAGSDREMDRKLQMGKVLDHYLQQSLEESCGIEESIRKLEVLVTQLEADEKENNSEWLSLQRCRCARLQQRLILLQVEKKQYDSMLATLSKRHDILGARCDNSEKVADIGKTFNTSFFSPVYLSNIASFSIYVNDAREKIRIKRLNIVSHYERVNQLYIKTNQHIRGIENWLEKNDRQIKRKTVKRLNQTCMEFDQAIRRLKVELQKKRKQ